MKIVLIAAAVFVAVAGVAYAKAWPSNIDHESYEETVAYADELFSGYDKNGDNFFTREEIIAYYAAN